jgi:hypothetical protein
MGGNRGLNTQHVIDGIRTSCEGRQDKTNGKWQMDQRWLEVVTTPIQVEGLSWQRTNAH